MELVNKILFVQIFISLISLTSVSYGYSENQTSHFDERYFFNGLSWGDVLETDQSKSDYFYRVVEKAGKALIDLDLDMYMKMPQKYNNLIHENADYNFLTSMVKPVTFLFGANERLHSILILSSVEGGKTCRTINESLSKIYGAPITTYNDIDRKIWSIDSTTIITNHKVVKTSKEEMCTATFISNKYLKRVFASEQYLISIETNNKIGTNSGSKEAFNLSEHIKDINKGVFDLNWGDSNEKFKDIDCGDEADEVYGNITVCFKDIPNTRLNGMYFFNKNGFFRIITSLKGEDNYSALIHEMTGNSKELIYRRPSVDQYIWKEKNIIFEFIRLDWMDDNTIHIYNYSLLN